jgi:hypothetical protein
MNSVRHVINDILSPRARHFIRYDSNQEMRVQNAVDDVTSTFHVSIFGGLHPVADDRQAHARPRGHAVHAGRFSAVMTVKARPRALACGSLLGGQGGSLVHPRTL